MRKKQELKIKKNLKTKWKNRFIEKKFKKNSIFF